jgi:transcriptional regulator GlxA family with amidase domain
MDQRVEQTIAVLDHRLHTRLTLAALAAEVNLSVSGLTRLFRQDTGMTPAAYLHRLRMIRARILIERTSLSVSEVMAQVGITDPSHFARDFRRVHGFSPRALRQHLRLIGRDVASDRRR